MELEDIKKGEYTLTHAHGQPSQKVRVYKVDIEKEKVDIIYISDDSTKGMFDDLNKIECRLYLRELTD